MLREKERRGLEGGRESPGNLESVGSVERGSVLFTEITLTGPVGYQAGPRSQSQSLQTEENTF